MKLGVMAVLLAGLGGSAAVAQDRGPGALFERFDADGDGRVTMEEIEADRDVRFEELDADGDGAVSEAEFVARSVRQAEERAGRMFERLDADGDGSLSRDTIEARGGRGPSAERLMRFDADGDGALTREEVETAMARFAERGGHRGKGFRNR